MQPLFVADRISLDHAAALMQDFGADAGDEAKARADRSRDVGNIVHFCRWRQVERLISALSIDTAVGVPH